MKRGLFNFVSFRLDVNDVVRFGSNSTQPHNLQKDFYRWFSERNDHWLVLALSLFIVVIVIINL